ncbi:MAG: HAMP domain-containing protein [Bacteroidales bacterium]|nr:HAMP domain-containing protein [Bacteroidales bacterium]
MKTVSISDKLILYFVSLSVCAIVIIGSYYYFFAKKALLDRTFDQLISLRLEKKNRIEQFFLDRDRDIKLISESEEIVRIIEVLNTPNSAPETILELQNNSNLSNYISAYGYYMQMHVVNRNKIDFKLIPGQYGAENVSNIDTIIDENLNMFCKDIYDNKGTIMQDFTKSKMLIYIGTPVINEINEITGFVVLEVPLTAINNIMFGYSENNGLGKTGETYLVGNDFLMRSNSRFKENAVLNLKVSSEAVTHALNGITGVGIVKDYRNISVLSSYSQVNISGLNWIIAAEIDEQEAMIPVNSIRNSILLISIIIAAGIFIFAFVISRRLTLPLKRLQKASEQIGEGNYNVKLEVTSQDEIGLLTEAFNNMIVQLKKQSIEIEAEKTKRVSSLIDGQEMERQRLSRDLHDSLGQSLLAVKMKLEKAKNTGLEMNQRIIIETQELLKSSIQEIRNISNDLMPPVLEAFGIEQGLKTLCRETSENTGISVVFSAENIPVTLDKKIQIFLYRISQEAINNITKHAASTEAAIAMSFKESFVYFNITDNGKGFDNNSIDNNGNGLLNIKQRVELLNGECKLFSVIGKGTSINIKIPV